MDNVGITHFGVGVRIVLCIAQNTLLQKYIFQPDVLQSSVANVIESFKPDKDVGAVIVGFDEHISYPKMLKAASYLLDPDVLFIGTNTDERFPMTTEYVVPGTGAIIKSIETCAVRNAFIIGKPSSYIADHIIKEHNIDPKRTLMIGDR